MSGPGEKVVFALDVCVVMCKRRADKTNTEIWSSGGGDVGKGVDWLRGNLVAVSLIILLLYLLAGLCIINHVSAQVIQVTPRHPANRSLPQPTLAEAGSSTLQASSSIF